MSAASFLDQLLKTGLSQVKGITGHPDAGKYAKGAAVGGVLGMLMGNKRGRSFGGGALKMGGMVALGTLAWKAYQEYQAQQARQTGVAAPAQAAPSFAALPAPQQEQHGRAMLKALVTAAKADGHIDAAEQARLDEALQHSGADAATRDWLQGELRRPVEPAEVAALATTPELAAEVYLASVIVVDETTTMERAYLDALARELRLAPGLQKQLEQQAATAA